MTDKEKLVEIVQNSVGGCARNWAEVIADGLIANGVTIQKWISVEERLPEYGDKVLVCDTREDYVGTMVLQKGVDFEGGKSPDYWCWRDEYYALNEFTHWMPLPPAPKGE